jgi:hypothetical protein
LTWMDNKSRENVLPQPLETEAITIIE